MYGSTVVYLSPVPAFYSFHSGRKSRPRLSKQISFFHQLPVIEYLVPEQKIKHLASHDLKGETQSRPGGTGFSFYNQKISKLPTQLLFWSL
jgi:hypothetical protein